MSRQTRSYFLRSLAFGVVLQAMLTPALIWWPSFAENIGSLKSLASPIPFLRKGLDMIDQTGVTGYVVAQHFFKGCNTLGVTAAVLLAMGAVAGEAHRGTLELWLSRPVSRTRLLSERFAAGLVAVALPVFATSASVPWLLGFVGETMAWDDLLRCSVHSALFLGAVYGVTFLLSALGNDPVRIAFAMLFLTIFEFATYMVKTITHWSLFRLVDIETFVGITLRKALDPGVELGFATATLACYAASLWVFHRRVP